MYTTRSLGLGSLQNMQSRTSRTIVTTLACSMIFLTGCANAPIEVPPTLVNWYTQRIDDKAFLQEKPLSSYAEYDDCTARILPKPSNAPPDLAYPSFVKLKDLQAFGGVFPQVHVSSFKSSRVSFADIASAVDVLVQDGTESPRYKAALEQDVRNIQDVRLPLTPGLPSVHTFADFMSSVTQNVERNRADLRKSGVKFSIPPGTATIINHNSRQYLLTAAHVLTELKGRQQRDVAVLAYPALDLSRISTADLHISSIHPTISSAELVGKPLQIYFHRTVCTEQRMFGVHLVYSLVPTIYDDALDELLANTPADFGDYMGGVSGAGVYSDGRIVGVFVGRGCAHGLPKGECSGEEGKNAYLRFVGINSIRSALKLSVELGAQFPLVLY